MKSKEKKMELAKNITYGAIFGAATAAVVKAFTPKINPRKNCCFLTFNELHFLQEFESLLQIEECPSQNIVKKLEKYLDQLLGCRRLSQQTACFELNYYVEQLYSQINDCIDVFIKNQNFNIAEKEICQLLKQFLLNIQLIVQEIQLNTSFQIKAGNF